MFQRWGVSADWLNYYNTMDRNYIAKQLEIFANLYEMGYVYRTFKPVYWYYIKYYNNYLRSPSSKTALAEAELEYNNEHKSLAVYFRYQVIF